MPVPVWMLLGFAAWTLLALVGSVGVYRWSRILTGRASLSHWRADRPQGDERYRRAMRAHQNCVENLPVFAAVVVALMASGAGGRIVDALAVTLLAARVCHTITHVGFVQTDRVVAIRFAFFFVQVLCMVALGGIAASRAWGAE